MPDISERAKRAIAGGNLALFVECITQENNIVGGFKAAAEIENIQALELLFVTVPNQHPHFSQAINEAFRLAATNGHSNVVSFLVERVEPEERQGMIHQLGNLPFRFAAANGHLSVIDCLLDSTQQKMWRQDMIHAANDQAFSCAAANGHLPVVSRLLEVSWESMHGIMINAAINHMFAEVNKENIVVATFLAAISKENSRPLNFGAVDRSKVEKLRELKGELVRRFSEEENVVEGLSANNAANRVIAELLDNRQEKLKTFSKLLTNQRLVSKQGIKGMRSQQVQLFPETIDEISSFLTTIRFSEKIPPRHQEISNAALEEIFCRPNHVVLPSTAQSLNLGRNNANDKSGIS